MFDERYVYRPRCKQPGHAIPIFFFEIGLQVSFYHTFDHDFYHNLVFFPQTMPLCRRVTDSKQSDWTMTKVGVCPIKIMGVLV